MTTFHPGDRVRYVGSRLQALCGREGSVTEAWTDRASYLVELNRAVWRCWSDELESVVRPAPPDATLINTARELVAVAGERQDHADNRRPDHADALTGPVERAEEQFRAALLASRLTEACDLLGPYATAELRVAGGLPTVKVRSSALYAALADHLGLPLGDGPGLRFTAHAHGVAWDVGPTP